jgi:threonine/homoserine/homoserine lactone efflux protein
LFGSGVIIGFVMAAPVGPVGVLCAQRTLHEGRVAGMVSGLGAAVADTIFGFIAAFGLSVISDFLLNHQIWFRGIGGGVLIALGIKILVVGPAQMNGRTGRGSANDHMGRFASTFVLTITNPVTIMTFAGIFAAFGVMKAVVTAIDAWVLVAGVFVGSSLWWLFIALGINLLRAYISHHGMRWVGRVSAVIILIFGALAIISIATGDGFLPFD